VPAIDSIPLLLAADIWQVVFGIIVFVLYSIGQLVNAKEQAKKKPAQPRRPQRPPGQAPQGQALAGQKPPAAGQNNQEEALRREVEDFLRRAQGKPPKRELPARPQSKPKPRKQKSRRPTAGQLESSAQLLPSEAAQPATHLGQEGHMREEGVAEHVASHLSSKQMIEHAKHLGEQVVLSEERLESRLHQKFDHQLGSLKQQKKSTAPAARELSAAEEVVELLKKPGGMRQLVIAQEILRRPEW